MDYYRYLRMLGLTEDETKPLILAHLRSRERRRLGNAEFRYWTKEGDTLLLKAVADELAVSDRVRSALSEIYRHSDDDAMFAQLYRPYDERLSFLTSPQQVQLQHGRLQFRLAARNGPAGGLGESFGQPPMNLRSAGLHPESDPAWRGFLDTILPPATLFEYELRESPLAGDLRASGVELSETEFREAYRVLAKLADGPDARTYREARVELRKLVGSQRFDEIWARRDPVYPIVDQVMRAHGFPQTTILAAYGVLNGAQDAFVEAAAMTDPIRGIAAANEIAASEERQLGGIVGDDVAALILTARAQALFQMSQETSVTP
jgi:hypothetical protein